MGASWLEPTRKLRRLSDESHGSKNMSEPHRRSLPGRHSTLLLSLHLSHLPLKKKEKTLYTHLMGMHTHVTRGSIHCGDTCERNLHFQLNCWPSLQNARLDSAPSSPARLLLLKQPLGARWKRLLHHDDKLWSQQNYWWFFFFRSFFSLLFWYVYSEVPFLLMKSAAAPVAVTETFSQGWSSARVSVLVVDLSVTLWLPLMCQITGVDVAR